MSYTKAVIKKIKNTININQKFDDIKSRSNEMLAHQILSPYLPKKYFTKTSYSINYVPILHILNDIIIYKPKSVLEFGAGLSTIVLNNAIHDLQLDTHIYSVDNDMRWLNYVESHIQHPQSLSFHCCPVEKTSGKIYTQWYNVEADKILSGIDQFDMYIIDGPWSKLGPHARYGAVDYILSKKINADNVMIYVDDIDREDELFIYQSLLNKLKIKGARYYRYARISNNTMVETRPFKL